VRKGLFLLFLFLPLTCSAVTNSKFIQKCVAGDRDAIIIAERIYKNDDSKNIKTLCEQAYNSLHDGNTLYLDCKAETCTDNVKIKSLESLSEDAEGIDFLYLRGNALSDLSSLKPFISGRRFGGLDIKNNPVEDYSVLYTAKWYSELSIGNENFDTEKMNELAANLPNVHRLDISNTKVDNLSFVSLMPELDNLNVSYTHVRDLTPLFGGHYWTALALNGLELTNIDFLKPFDKLYYLDVNDNQIDNIDSLGNSFPSLLEFSAENNHIKAIPDLRQRGIGNSLAVINLNGNEITSVDNFYWPFYAGHGSIGLANNKIRNISRLNDFNEPNILEIYGNPISSTDCLKQISSWYQKNIFCSQL